MLAFVSDYDFKIFGRPAQEDASRDHVQEGEPILSFLRWFPIRLTAFAGIRYWISDTH
jgi:hypothetical protein